VNFRVASVNEKTNFRVSANLASENLLRRLSEHISGDSVQSVRRRAKRGKKSTQVKEKYFRIGILLAFRHSSKEEARFAQLLVYTFRSFGVLSHQVPTKPKGDMHVILCVQVMTNGIPHITRPPDVTTVRKLNDNDEGRVAVLVDSPPTFECLNVGRTQIEPFALHPFAFESSMPVRFDSAGIVGSN
jgi:hypothetical protein